MASIFRQGRDYLRKAFTRALLLGTLSTAVPVAAQPQAPHATETVTKAQEPQIHELLAEFGRTALGKELLAQCETYNIVFSYDKKIGANGNSGTYSNLMNIVRIDPAQPLEDRINCLAHEIRHALLRHTLYLDKVEKSFLSPRQMFVLRQYMEADAFAYAAYFCADRARALDLPLNQVSPYLSDRLTLTLRDELNSADGLRLDEYRARALEPAFNSIGAYYEDHKSFVEDAFEPVPEHLRRIRAGSTFATGFYLDMLARAPDDAAFEGILRHFGGLSFDPAAATALSDAEISSAAVLDIYPMAAVHHTPEDKTEELRRFLERQEKTYRAALDVLKPLLEKQQAAAKIVSTPRVSMTR